jgi:hypothetical protein
MVRERAEQLLALFGLKRLSQHLHLRFMDTDGDGEVRGSCLAV